MQSSVAVQQNDEPIGSRGLLASRPSSRRGFSLADVLVSVSVIAVLISLLMPSMSAVRETTRRVVCASNVRQIGLGLAMYAEGLQRVPDAEPLREHRGSSEGDDGSESHPANRWDGVGMLFQHDYLARSRVYYCPSHFGNHPFSKYARQWESNTGEIGANFHYRGLDPHQRPLRLFGDPAVAIVTDSLRSAQDYNHRFGANVLSVDMSSMWFNDQSGALASNLPTSDADSMASQRVLGIWLLLDMELPKR